MGAAQGTHVAEKKIIEDALEQLGDSGKTTHPLILDVWKARKINALTGAAMIAPWQVGQLDEEWQAVFDGLFEIEQRQAAETKNKQLFDQVLAKRRAAHPTYRK